MASFAPPQSTPSSALAVIVTCHAAYLPFLAEALASIDAQSPVPAEKVLVLDDCPVGDQRLAIGDRLLAIDDQQLAIGDAWKILHGNWHNPNPARNAGLAATSAPWLVFWDADDTMPPGYLSALLSTLGSRPSARLAIVYPALGRAMDGESAATKITPFNYWSLRQWNWIGTQSAWRREATERVGGWDEALPNRDDWNLAMRITAAGWTAEPLPAPAVILRRHDCGHRWASQGSGLEEASWRTRTLAVVSLLSGRDDCLPAWRDWLLAEPLPLRAALYVVDDSGSAAFARLLDAALNELRPRFASVTLCPRGDNATALPRTDLARHQRVAELYSDVLQRIGEDLVLTLEDDVIPPPGALRKLHDPMAWFNPIGAVAGVYALPQNPALVCGSVCAEHWRSDQRLETFPAELTEAGFVPGGCTLWANWALRNCLPLSARIGPKGELIGWDTQLSVLFRQARYTLHLHGGVRCEHRIKS